MIQNNLGIAQECPGLQAPMCTADDSGSYIKEWLCLFLTKMCIILVMLCVLVIGF